MTTTLPPPATTSAGRTPSRFRLGEQLAGLRDDATVHLLSYAERANPGARWILGIRPVSDSASVHASHWERHPSGDEILVLLEGSLDVILSPDGVQESLWRLDTGEALVIPQGHWHRLELRQPGRLMFVTPSTGSEHRLRQEGAPPGAEPPLDGRGGVQP